MPTPPPFEAAVVVFPRFAAERGFRSGEGVYDLRRMNDSVTIDSSSEARTLGSAPLDLIAMLSAAATRLQLARDESLGRLDEDDGAAQILSEYRPYAEYGRAAVEDLEGRLAIVRRLLGEVEGEGLTKHEKAALISQMKSWVEAGLTKRQAYDRVWEDFHRLHAIRKTILYRVERGMEVSESSWDMTEQFEMFVAEAIYEAERFVQGSPQQQREVQRWRRDHVVAEKRKSLGHAPSKCASITRTRLASRRHQPRSRGRRSRPRVRRSGVRASSRGSDPGGEPEPGPGPLHFIAGLDTRKVADEVPDRSWC